MTQIATDLAPHTALGRSPSLEHIFRVLTSHLLVTPTGRVVGDATIWESLGKAHLQLADAVRKSVLHELDSRDIEVGAVIGETFVIEAEVSRTTWVSDKITVTLQTATQALLGDLPVVASVQQADFVYPFAAEASRRSTTSASEIC